jgi:uncharacterized membrane protein
MNRDLLRERREWLLRRNCSLSPRQMGMAYGLMCVFSFAVATGFVMIGLWQVLLFTVLEMTAVAAAFLYFARHATDYEQDERDAARTLLPAAANACPLRRPDSP